MMEESECLKVYPTPEELSSVCSTVKCSQSNCNAFFQSTSNLNMHLIKHHKMKSNALSPKKETRFFCPAKSCPYFKDSKKYFTKLKYLKQHYLKVHALKSFVCNKCDKKFSTEAFKTAHMKNCGKEFTCTCGYSYTSSEAILTHCKRKGEGHSFVSRVKTQSIKVGNEVPQLNAENNGKKSERLIYPKIHCDMSFPIHYIAAIALSELSTPCNHSKVLDKSIQTDLIDCPPVKNHSQTNGHVHKSGKKRQSSQHTQTMGKVKRMKISAETQTNSDYLKHKVKHNLKAGLRRRKKSMETQTKDHFREDMNLGHVTKFGNSIVKKQNNSKSDYAEKEGKNSDYDKLEKEKNGKWLWDNQFFEQEKHSSAENKGDKIKNDLFGLTESLCLLEKEPNLNELSRIDEKVRNTHYARDGVPENQIFDLNKLCNIETQTEIEAFLTECDEDTAFTLCSTTETQTTDDFDSLLYSNMCTQTCEEVDELFDFNFVHIETQTTWPDF